MIGTDKLLIVVIEVVVLRETQLLVCKLTLEGFSFSRQIFQQESNTEIDREKTALY